MSGHDRDVVVYSDEKYVLGKKDGLPYLSVNGKVLKLTCHPFEPCLYITDETGCMTAVHNSFDPSSVLYAFRGGQRITSITGFEYDAKDFCRMVEYASGMVDVSIDYAEKVFGGRAKKKDPKPDKKKEKETLKGGGEHYRPEADVIIEDARLNSVMEKYPDSVVDIVLVKNEDGRGRNAHWFALLRASRKLFIDENDEVTWHFDAAKAEGKQTDAKELFAEADRDGPLNYRKAFLYPPYENGYKNSDFDKLNAALFPNGTDGLEVYEWTTDWSEYFDEGHEWWGALCLTVFDKSLDRFAVIMASATD